MSLLQAARAAAPPAKCALRQVAEWRLTNQYRPVVDGSINGQGVAVLLDTGASQTVIARPAAERFGLPIYSDRSQRVFRGQRFFGAKRFFGTGGEMHVDDTYFADFKVAGLLRENWPAIVVAGQELGGDPAVLLGYDFFSELDVEFNLADGSVRLWQSTNCEHSSLAYWTKDALEVPLVEGAKIHVTVSLNDKPFLALLDSGSSLTTLSLETAALLGITPQTPGVIPGGCRSGLGRERYDSWIATLQSFAIGAETIRTPRIRFADLWQHSRYEETGSRLRRRLPDLPDLILGGDFLHTHRVLVAHSQRKLYFSYSGGTVFPAVAGKPCREQ